MAPQVVALGQIARDLVLRVPEVPGSGGTATVRGRWEVLGGKGANQAVGLAQLGAEVALVGVVGDDRTGHDLLAQARADGIDVTHVVRRTGLATALIVDLVDDTGEWRHLEDIPDAALLGVDDVLAASTLLAEAEWVLVRLQQPFAATLAAARLASTQGAHVVLDGAPSVPGPIGDLLSCAEVVRADAREAERLAGRALGDVADTSCAARELLRRGPSLVVLEAAGKGNVVATPGGSEFLPHASVDVVDSTGAGDALVAAMTSALMRGVDPHEAAHLAVAASAATTEHAGGRPRLNG
ncbi:PfkB family carbohydrate kinase [Actinokineospora xionganensis]|uniref:Bifunctional hydroxymethylpyrimidine kinase/phosphomethylpyrimidine kinase n=1 Tax=Actinokineospora xionganensis TaxID=2684470 RepID=A0ABR7LEC9_9PSEU|nr:PfkB family carbohydrate kinase [Actinokineospora xionganensis]MBC6451046.1 bifunctional hydroxymethylpyrimidine kinase/phosphomethylpyrimidine kinase [Actinokineospora xionganensis]